MRAAEQALREALLEVRASELDRGVCLAGPHRDELELSVRDLPARGYASHGESWSLALALRLASFDLLRAGREDPVLILDDVFAELDAGRRDRLAALVAEAEQVLVTAAVPEDIPSLLTGAHFKVSAGSLTEAAPPRESAPQAAAATARRQAGGRAWTRRGRRCALTRSAPGWPPRPWRGPEPTRGRGEIAQGPASASRIKPRIQNEMGLTPQATPSPSWSARPRRDDPQPLTAAVGGLLSARGWRERAAVGAVFGHWPDIVGPQLALHTKPESFEAGELTVSADSSAWATQVRLMAPQLLKRLAEELGHGTVRHIRVNGPSGPPRRSGRLRVR